MGVVPFLLRFLQFQVSTQVALCGDRSDRFFTNGIMEPTAGHINYFPGGYTTDLTLTEFCERFADKYRCTDEDNEEVDGQTLMDLWARKRGEISAPHDINDRDAQALHSYTVECPLYKEINAAMREACLRVLRSVEFKPRLDYIYHLDRCVGVGGGGGGGLRRQRLGGTGQGLRNRQQSGRQRHRTSGRELDAPREQPPPQCTHGGGGGLSVWSFSTCLRTRIECSALDKLPLSLLWPACAACCADGVTYTTHVTAYGARGWGWGGTERHRHAGRADRDEQAVGGPVQELVPFENGAWRCADPVPVCPCLQFHSTWQTPWAVQPPFPGWRPPSHSMRMTPDGPRCFASRCSPHVPEEGAGGHVQCGGCTSCA